MNINGIILNTDVADIIKELRSQLEDAGIHKFAKFFDSGDDLMVCCPYHKDGQERRPSAGIRKADGLFHCLACGETHSLAEMISYCFGYSREDYGYKWLKENFVIAKEEKRERIVINLSRGSNNRDVFNVVPAKIGENELDKYRYTHNYLYERGLTDEIIEQFDLGYDKTTDSITFPVRDINGDCLFVARRAIKTKYFDLPKAINKPLYGMYEVSRVQSADKLYVCEGLFDCLRLWCNGKIAVAGFGCLFNTYQIKQIQDLPIRTIVLALDNDEAGISATKRLRLLLTNKIIKEVVLPIGRKDIGECTNDEIQNLKEIFI